MCALGRDGQHSLDGVADIDQESGTMSVSVGEGAPALGGEVQTPSHGVSETTVAYLRTGSPPDRTSTLGCDGQSSLIDRREQMASGISIRGCCGAPAPGPGDLGALRLSRCSASVDGFGDRARGWMQVVVIPPIVTANEDQTQTCVGCCSARRQRAEVPSGVVHVSRRCASVAVVGMHVSSGQIAGCHFVVGQFLYGSSDGGCHHTIIASPAPGCISSLHPCVLCCIHALLQPRARSVVPACVCPLQTFV